MGLTSAAPQWEAEKDRVVSGVLGIWESTCLPLHSDQLVSTCQRQNSISITCLHPTSYPSCGSPLPKCSSNPPHP